MSEVHCSSEKELGKAIKSEVDTIYVEGDLKNKVIKIKATGKVAWGVCAASLAVAIALIVSVPKQAGAAAATGGATAMVSSLTFVAGETVAGTATASILGSAAIPAIMIGVAAGGVGALNTLRDKYKIVETEKHYVKLKRKK
jgi:hypothetical protein